MLGKTNFSALTVTAVLSFIGILTLTSCSTTKTNHTKRVRSVQGGGYYLDDGPMADEPEDLMAVPDAVPRVEQIASGPSKPYVVFGKTYTPMTSLSYYRQQGVGSWYGRKFHGQKTSSGEVYDMFAMTAAHPTLPIPSYARVTSLETGRQVIVRVNDRGPFLSERIIDLSYTAAYKLGYKNKGSGKVEVELLLPDEIARLNQNGVSHTEKSTVQALSSGYYLQLGAYQDASHAQNTRSQLALRWANRVPNLAVTPSGSYYKLFAGPFASKQEAVALADEMRSTGTGAFVVKR